MFFNPLFIDTNSAGSVQNQKNTKLGKSQYLFSDIIKISLSQTESTESESAPLFNLSLVNNSNSISSLFSTAEAKQALAANETEGSVQNAEAMLIEFLQYAFINQDSQAPKALNLKELMKDKELMLSKESLTSALSQLTQIYQPTVNDKDGTAAAESLSSESLTGQVLSSLDEKGKVILNFKNTTSQIKIELTKLNSQEKELFISTKIIPMTMAAATDNAVSETTQQKNSTNTEKKGEAIVIPIEQGTTESDKEANPDTSVTSVKETETNNSNGTAQQENVSKDTIAPPLQTGINDTAKATGSSTASGSVSPDIKIENRTETKGSPKAKQGKTESQSEIPKTAPQAQVVSEEENKSNEYKLRVVEINSEKVEKEPEAKIYSMSPFEKNILKKSSITFTQTEATGKKETASSANTAKPETTVTAGKETIKTISQADNEILKTNNMLFENKAEEGSVKGDIKNVNMTDTASTKVTGKNITMSDLSGKKTDITDTQTVSDTSKAAKPADSGTAVTSESEDVIGIGAKVNNKKNAPVSAEIKPEQVKTTAETKDGKVESKKNQSAEIKSAKQDEIKNDEKNLKNAESSRIDEKVTKQDTSKNVKQAAVADDSKSKNVDFKKDMAESNSETEKKAASETEKSSLKQDSNLNQKDSNSSSNQNNSEKRGNDNKQFSVQNVMDKDKMMVSKDDTIKEPNRQADVSKTIKTYEIIKEIKSFIEQGNKSSLTLRIVPENLGSVKISLDMVKNVMQARIDVDSENVKQFVQTNLDSLKQSLNQNGVNIGMLQVNVSSSDQKQPRFVSPFKKKLDNSGKEISFEEADPALSKKILGYNSYDYLA